MFVFVWQRPRKTTSSWFYQFFKDNELRKNWDKYLTQREQDDIICTQQIKSTFRNNIWYLYIIHGEQVDSTEPPEPNEQQAQCVRRRQKTLNTVQITEVLISAV